MLANLTARAGGSSTMTPQRDGRDFEQLPGDLSGNGLSSPKRQPVRATRYRMSYELVASDGDFLVLTDAGEHAFRIVGKAIDNDIIRIEELNGRLLYEAAAHSSRNLRSLTVVDANQAPAGRVSRHKISPLRDQFAIELVDGTLYSVDGALSTREYTITGPVGRVATISRRWFRARGSYGVEIAPGQQALSADMHHRDGPNDSGKQLNSRPCAHGQITEHMHG